MPMQYGKITILAAMTFCMSLQHAFSAPINAVDVHVIDENGSTSQILLNKMSNSINVVSEQLFLLRDDAEVSKEKASYENLISEIAERVFTGYEITATELNPGPKTKLIIRAKSWSKTISKPTIDLRFSGIEPSTSVFLEKRIPELRTKLNNTISGASVEAGDWASGVLRQLVRKEMENSLPEFKAAVDLVQENGETIIQVIIYPVGQVVRDLSYEMRSEDIPNILLFDVKKKYAKKFDELRGLPVDYVEHHKQEIVKGFEDAFSNEWVCKNYNLSPQIEIIPGANLFVNVMLKSPRYKVWFEGYADLGRKNENISGKAHLGKYISSKDEIFGEAELVTDNVQWNFTLGYTRDVGKTRWTYGRRMPLGENDYRFDYVISPKWQFRAEHFSGRDRNEFGMRYRIHEFLSAEYVHAEHESYLRVIGNL